MAQEVRALIWQPVPFHPGYVEMSLSKTPNLNKLTVHTHTALIARVDKRDTRIGIGCPSCIY